MISLSEFRRLPSHTRAALGEALRGNPRKLNRASARALEKRGLLLVSNGRIQDVPEAARRLYSEYLDGGAASETPLLPTPRRQ
jgi:hypothetical protein